MNRLVYILVFEEKIFERHPQLLILIIYSINLTNYLCRRLKLFFQYSGIKGDELHDKYISFDIKDRTVFGFRPFGYT